MGQRNTWSPQTRFLVEGASPGAVLEMPVPRPGLRLPQGMLTMFTLTRFKVRSRCHTPEWGAVWQPRETAPTPTAGQRWEARGRAASRAHHSPGLLTAREGLCGRLQQRAGAQRAPGLPEPPGCGTDALRGSEATKMRPCPRSRLSSPKGP